MKWVKWVYQPLIVLIRMVAFAALIYVGVWLDSKIVRSIMFTSFFVAIEGLGWFLVRSHWRGDAHDAR